MSQWEFLKSHQSPLKMCIGRTFLVARKGQLVLIAHFLTAIAFFKGD
jgi:hypothetical protein